MSNFLAQYFSFPTTIAIVACLLIFSPFVMLLIVFPILNHYGILPKQHIPGKCDHCRYNLTGNESGTCPECGEAIVDR